MQEPTTTGRDTLVAGRLYALGVISGAVHAELKDLAMRLNAFSEAPAANALSPALQSLQRAALFCGFWGVGNYLGALRELAHGIEAIAPLSVERTEYQHRIKTLAAGVNALGLYVRDVHNGVAASSSALNEQFANVIRKARPALLEMPPAQLAPMMFMPAPPSLEVEASWCAAPGASHLGLLGALALAAGEPTEPSLAAVAQSNPYRTLSGLFEAAACQAGALEPSLAGSVKDEYARLEGVLRAGAPTAPPVPDSFLFSRLLHQIAFTTSDEPDVRAIRRRYALVKPRTASASGDAVSMFDVARKFAAGMAKFHDAYLQAALSNTPAPIVKLTATLFAESHKLESAAFSSYAAALHQLTGKWTGKSDLSYEDWTRGAVLVLLLQESAESWGNQQAQSELASLADLMLATGVVAPCATMQQAAKSAAIQKGCAALLAQYAELKVAIETALRSVGDTELSESQRQRVVEVAGQRAADLLGVADGFCMCVGLPGAAAFAQRLTALALDPLAWGTSATRAELFDGLARMALLLGRLRPGSLIDMQIDELGPFAPALDEPGPIDRLQELQESQELRESQEMPDGDPAIAPEQSETETPPAAPDSNADTRPEADEISVAAAEVSRNDVDISQADEAGGLFSDDTPGAFAEDGFSFDDDDQPPARARHKEPVDAATLRSQFVGAARGVDNVLKGDSELLKVMFEESHQCLSDIERRFAMWSAPDAAPHLLAGTVSEVRRHIHTLKGVCRTCGLDGLGEILHAMETRLDATADDGRDLGQDLPAYVEAVSAVRHVIERAHSQFALGVSSPLPSGEDAAAAAGNEARQNCQNRPASERDNSADNAADNYDALEAHGAATSPTETSPESGLGESRVSTAQHIESDSAPALQTIGTLMVSSVPPSGPSGGAPSSGSADGTVRIPLRLAARVGDASGHLLAASQRSLEINERTTRHLKELEVNIKRMGPVLRELDILAEASIPSSSGGSSQGFDPLELDRYTALQELVRRLKESFEDSEGSVERLAENLRQAARSDQDRAQLSDDLQRESSELTLVVVSSQRSRLEHVVARACQDTGKVAALSIEPGCRVPAAALDKLMPVFEHLLRNAVAHGIELPEARTQAGKPAEGTITIGLPNAAAPDASVMRICVRDDGAGIDHERVLATAFKRGIAVRGERYTEEAIRELLFVPGFSTTSSVTQVAGRGVGLDVVRSAMSTVGGMVTANCASGAGAEFVLTLPTDTSSMSVLPVSANGYHCLLPLSLVTRIVPVSSNMDVQLDEASKNVVVGGVVFQLIDLATQVPAVRQEKRRGGGHLVLMTEASTTKAVLVDSVGSQTRAVVRPLGPFVRDVPGMVAGTLTPDGGVDLVVNPLRLRERAAAATVASQHVKPAQAQIMVVDDSSTVRLVTSRLLRRLGYEAVAARDGLEALQMLANGVRPAAFLCDLEMPRMGGFELISEIRAKHEFAATPIYVVSSRAANKYRERAQQLGATGYLTKPWSDAQLAELVGKAGRVRAVTNSVN
jgi:chemotaxis protein histidine kinase CheA/ActR/RegA family two-component response regulator